MRGHVAFFYDEYTDLLDHLTDFVKTGLEGNEIAIVVGTEQHRHDLKERLLAGHHIGLSAATDANYFALDAATLLSLFMVHGWPDERLFRQVIDQIIGSIAQGRVLRIYAEMVAVLSGGGNPLAAIQLERSWNRFLALNPVCLLECGYPASGFRAGQNEYLLARVCDSHSSAVNKPH